MSTTDFNSLKTDMDRIHWICKGLAEKGEESVFVKVNLEKTTCFVMGSEIGLQWLEMQGPMIQNFFQFCAGQSHLKQEKDPDLTESSTCVKVKTESHTSELVEVIRRSKNITEGQTNDLPLTVIVEDQMNDSDEDKESLRNSTAGLPSSNLTQVNERSKLRNEGQVGDHAGISIEPHNLLNKDSDFSEKHEKLCQTSSEITTQTPLQYKSKDSPQRPSSSGSEHRPKSVPTLVNQLSSTIQTLDSKSLLMSRNRENGGQRQKLFTRVKPVPSELKEVFESEELKEVVQGQILEAGLEESTEVVKLQLLKNENNESKYIVEGQNFKSECEKSNNSVEDGTSKIKIVETDDIFEGQYLKNDFKEESKRKFYESDIDSKKNSYKNKKSGFKVGKNHLNIESRNTIGKDGDKQMAVRRTGRTPKPKKLHQIECFVEHQIKHDGSEKIHNTIKDVVSMETVANISNVENSDEMKAESSVINDCTLLDESLIGMESEKVQGHSDKVQGHSDKDDDDNKSSLNSDSYGSDDAKPKRTRLKCKTKKSDNKVILENYINNMRSRLKRGKKRGEGHINCQTCDLTFKSVWGLRIHEKKCRVIKCPRCQIECESLDDLENHFQSHKGENSLKCRFCEKEFFKMNALKKHETTHLVKHRFSCPLCSKSVLTRSFLRLHLRQIHNERRPICTECGIFFENKFEYHKHITKHPSNKKLSKFVCKKCGKMFETLNYLKRHNRFFHKAKGERICEQCLEIFPDISQYNEHMKVHEWDKPNTCVHCRQNFETKEKLQDHIQTIHNEGKKYVCEICGFEAYSSRAYKHHKLEHEDTMPYTCKVCNQGFPVKNLYDYHMVSHVTEKLFVCEICGKKFKRRSTLRSHMFVHSDGMKCKFCDRVFKSVGGLNYHIVRCHADKVNVLNYKKILLKCEKCDKFFPSKASFNQHQISHSTERSWACPLCQRKFKTEKQMNEHKANHAETKDFFCMPCNRGFSSKQRLEAHIKTEKHRFQSAKSPEVIEQEQELKTAQKLKENSIKSEQVINVQGTEDIIINASDLNQSTMIDLPETTILIIGDDGHVEYIAENIKDQESIQIVQPAQETIVQDMQEVHHINMEEGTQEVHHINMEEETLLTGEYDHVCDDGNTIQQLHVLKI